MKIDSWDDIPNTSFPRFQGIPLAYFDKEVTRQPNNFKPVVIYEDNNTLFIGNSDGERRNIPFNLISILDSCPKS